MSRAWRRLARCVESTVAVVAVFAATGATFVAAQPSLAVNPVAALAGQVGVSQCATMARIIGEQAVGPYPSAGVVMTAESGTDRSLISTSIETRDGAGLHFVSAFMTPNAKGGCEGGYDDVRYWDKNCDSLVMDELRGVGAIRPLGPDIGTLVAGPQQHVYLMPAGAGCISIRKALLF